MSCVCGWRIATGISECLLVNYIYVPRTNLRYVIYVGGVPASEDVYFSIEESGDFDLIDDDDYST